MKKTPSKKSRRLETTNHSHSLSHSHSQYGFKTLGETEEVKEGMFSSPKILFVPSTFIFNKKVMDSEDQEVTRFIAAKTDISIFSLIDKIGMRQVPNYKNTLIFPTNYIPTPFSE